MTAKPARRRLNRSTLRRLIRGRPYTSIAQVRRYFEIEEEEVTAVEGPGGVAYLALPEHDAAVLGQLWRDGKIGVHLSPNVRAAVIEGVYPIDTPAAND